MPVTRELLFANGTVYSITDTLRYIAELFWRNEEIQDYIYEAIISQLQDLKYNLFVDYDDFIANPWTGVLTQLDLWLLEFGIVDRVFQDEDFDGTIATFEIDADGNTISDLSGEEQITDEDEEELVTGAYILARMNEEYDANMSDLED